jgi:hypothetical protein
MKPLDTVAGQHANNFEGEKPFSNKNEGGLTILRDQFVS